MNTADKLKAQAASKGKTRIVRVTEEQQALWDIYRILGNDTDGDETPAALIAGERLGGASLVQIVKDSAENVRQELDMESEESEGLRELLGEWVAWWENDDAGADAAFDSLLERTRKAVP